jgi:hypothetical protein
MSTAKIENHGEVFPSQGVSWINGKSSFLTVGQLRQLLEGVPDKTHVVIERDGWYLNVEATAKPTDDPDGYTCVTFFTSEANPYDPRQ